ncbi:MAG TPA: hypothetical protein VFH11_12535 [Gemmatimonadota bacterium]|nr:hypothetical protein [Gemmatimonadota bacterium]
MTRASRSNLCHTVYNRSVLATILLAVLPWLAACAGDAAPTAPVASQKELGPAAIPRTVYVLHRLDGSSLPRRICPDRAERVTKARIALRSDGVFSLVVLYRTGDSPASEYRATGTYAVNRNTVTFQGGNGITVTGTLRDGGARLVIEFPYCDPPTTHRAVFLRE